MNFYNGMFIGGGKGTGLIDSFVLKDYNNKPYIPGSTVKGKVKHNYTMLVNSFLEERDFHISQIFGQGGNSQGTLYFEDLKLQDNCISDKYLYDTRTGILVNRYNNQVKDQALFQYEVSGISEEQKFAGGIEGYIDKESYKKQIILLYTAIRMVETIGGNQSRGLGWLGEDCQVKIYLDNRYIDEDALRNWGDEVEV